MGQVIQQQSTGHANKQRIIKILLTSTIIIVFIVIVLFYFNIFPFKPFQQNNKPITNTPTKYSSNVFQYDTAKAKTLLTQYIEDTIKPELLPAKIEVKQGLFSTGIVGSIKYEFGFFFNSKENTISAEFVYKENTNVADAYGVSIQSNGTTEATATASLANTFLSSYFVNPYPISNCQAKGTASYCENFQILNEGNRSYGIILKNNGSNSTLRTISCFIPKDSQYYTKLKSCISL